ncbi:MAG TPA: hypothetical protein VLL48_09535, partial [Longimicrobiales bacterium]|nr:hypothetical protein [Longimicrobiales bacterium]
NYGLVFFTGKNVYALGLDSLGDALETTALLGLAALALGAEARGGAEASSLEGSLEPVGAVWWHPSERRADDGETWRDTHGEGP